MKGNIPVTKKEAALPDPHIRFVPVTFPSKGGEFHFLESDIVEPLKDYALASDKSFMAFCVTDKGISIPSPPKAVSSSSSPKIEVPPNTEIVFIAFGQSGKLKKLKKTFDKKKKPPIRKGQQICWGVYAPFGLKDMQKNPQEMLIYEALLLLEEASSGDANLMRMHLDGLTFRQMAEQMLDGKSPDQEMIENKANAIQQQFKRPRIGSMAKFSLIVNRLMAKHGWNYDELL
ncbi:MAG: hypothetical protein DRI57_29370 [Deltaproteobacteria bacterium]|nr:MAG: hypothetical protein DRI57_29370 [Deltaproteobacteria bacterium]